MHREQPPRDRSARHRDRPERLYDRTGTNLNQFLHARGVQQLAIHHPADRFWTFQLIEAALFVAVAAALVGMAVWRVRRRTIQCPWFSSE